MIGLVRQLLARGEPVLSEATVRDARAIAKLHDASFHRGWSDGEIEAMLLDRAVLAHRAMRGRNLVGFILSRRVLDEAEILSVAVMSAWQGRGVARRLLELHLRRLAAFGTRAVFLEVEETNTSARRLYQRAGFNEVGRREGYYPHASGKPAAALVLRRDL